MIFLGLKKNELKKKRGKQETISSLRHDTILNEVSCSQSTFIAHIVMHGRKREHCHARRVIPVIVSCLSLSLGSSRACDLIFVPRDGGLVQRRHPPKFRMRSCLVGVRRAEKSLRTFPFVGVARDTHTLMSCVTATSRTLCVLNTRGSHAALVRCTGNAPKFFSSRAHAGC